MLSRAREYHYYARECVRMAEKADSEEARHKLFALAKVWMEAALIEVDEEGRDREEGTLLACDLRRTEQ